MLLLLLAQFSGCANFLCSLSLGGELDSSPIPIAIPSVEEIVPLSEDDFVVVTSPLRSPTAMEVTRVRFNHEELIASTPALFPSHSSRAVFPKEGGWWFSRQGNEGVVSSVFFVESDETLQQTRVKLPRQYPLLWLPIRGEEPRGVQVSVAKQQPALLIDEVTPSGVKPIGAFPWWQTGMTQTLLSGRWSAEALRGDRVAVVAVDGPPEELTLILRVLGGAEAVESTLPCAVAIDYPLATAVDGSDRVAIVGLTKAGEVVAMIVDVDQPQSLRCRVISALGETAAKPPFGNPSVVWAGDRFVSAWIGDDGTVRAGELGDLRVPPLIIAIGQDADVDRPLRQLVHSGEGLVTFVWKQRGGGFIQRRMPKNLNGYAFAADLERALCAAVRRARRLTLRNRAPGEPSWGRSGMHATRRFGPRASPAKNLEVLDSRETQSENFSLRVLQERPNFKYLWVAPASDALSGGRASAPRWLSARRPAPARRREPRSSNPRACESPVRAPSRTLAGEDACGPAGGTLALPPLLAAAWGPSAPRALRPAPSRP